MGGWIWTDSADSVRNSYIRARRSFSLESRPDRAVLAASADSKYKLYVNGVYVGKGPVRSGDGYVYYDTHEITGLLRPGLNAVAFLVHHFGESTFGYVPAAPGLICRLDIQHGDRVETIVTDETWKVCHALDWTSEGDRMSPRLGFQEVYDAERLTADWNSADASEESWSSAVVVGRPPSAPWGELRAREIPLLAEERFLPSGVVGVFNSPEFDRDTPVPKLPDIMAAAELSPLTAGRVEDVRALMAPDGLTVVRTPRGGTGVVVILDFGREVFGNVELGIADSGGGCIDLGYGELLEDGRVKPNRADTKYLDRVMLGEGRLAWQSFEPRAFRYMQLEFRGLRRPVALEYVRINQTTYPAESVGVFECSDSLLNEIWRVGAYTTRLCMEDTFIDCPWRERAQWWGDARIESRVAYYAFGDTELLAQGLRQIAHSQKPDGSVMAMYPAGEERMLPDYSLIWVFSLLDYYAFSDDAELIEEVYPNVRRLMEWFRGFEDQDGLLSDVPGWLFIDWADLEKQGEVTALNCFYYQALRVASVVAGIAGEQEDGAAYLEAADRLRRAINKYLYSPRRGLYADCRVDGRIVEKFSRQANALAALFDIPDHYQKSTIHRQLINGGLPEVRTPYFMSYVLEALYAGERHDDALDIIRRKWGDMIRDGATTFWEMFTPEASLCHGWSACPTRDLLAEYVGIKPALGAQRYTVAPHTGGLKWAKGSVATPHGPLSVEWKAVRNSLNIDLEVPDSVRVDVYAPSISERVVISVDGKTWRSRFVTLGAGSHRVRVTADRPARPAVTDSGLAPAPLPQVEVLEEVSQLGRRRPQDAVRRRRRAGEREPRTRERRPEREKPAAVQKEEVAAEPAPAPVGPPQAEPEKKPRTRRRGGRGRSKPVETVVETAPEVQTQPEPAVQPEQPESSAQQVDSAPTARKPRRRGGRGRSRTSRAGQPGQDAPAEDAASSAEPAADAPPALPDATVAEADQTADAERLSKPKRPSRPRRPRKRPAETASPETAPPEPEPGSAGGEAD